MGRGRSPASASATALATSSTEPVQLHRGLLASQVTFLSHILIAISYENMMSYFFLLLDVALPTAWIMSLLLRFTPCFTTIEKALDPFY